MELKIQPYQSPEQILFNYEELKTMLLEKAEHYAAIVYTEEQIKDAKADRANLNRLKKALNDERLKREREYMESFNVFKAQINEIISIIDKPCAVIDKQIKEFEESQKAEKNRAILEYWESKNVPGWYQTIDTKWLNASASMKSIKTAIDAQIEQIEKDLAVIRALPTYAFEAEEIYKRTMSLSDAVSEAHRLQKVAERKAAWEAEQARKKAEAEAAAIRPAEPVDIPCTPYGAETTPAQAPEPEKQWVRFQALLSTEDAKALGNFFRSRNIEYKPV